MDEMGKATGGTLLGIELIFSTHVLRIMFCRELLQGVDAGLMRMKIGRKKDSPRPHLDDLHLTFCESKDRRLGMPESQSPKVRAPSNPSIS